MQDPSRGECYMVAEESLGREGPHFHPLTSDRAIGLLGDFTRFPSLSKMAARVALGFSRSWPLELVQIWPGIAFQALSRFTMRVMRSRQDHRSRSLYSATATQ